MPIQGNAAYQAAVQVVINGAILPVYSFSLDLNAYNMVTTFEVRCPIWALDGQTQPKQQTVDHCRQLQLACDAGAGYPAQIQLSYQQVSSPSVTSQRPTAFLTLESGYVDEIQIDLGANEQAFICRTQGALLQEARVQGDVPTFKRGDELVTYFVNRFAPTVQLQTVQSIIMAGHSFTDMDYKATARGHSVWDYISEVAQADGYIFTLHNSKGYYGPPGFYPGTPTVQLQWGRDLTECKIDHAARRTRNIQVYVIGYNQRQQRRIAEAIYPPNASNVTEKVYIDAGNNHTRASSLAYAQQQYRELASKEFVIQADLIPDPAFLKILAEFGPHFYVQLAGTTLPSVNSPLYHCKQAHVEFNGDTEQPAITVALTIENHDPTSQG